MRNYNIFFSTVNLTTVRHQWAETLSGSSTLSSTGWSITRTFREPPLLAVSLQSPAQTTGSGSNPSTTITATDVSSLEILPFCGMVVMHFMHSTAFDKLGHDRISPAKSRLILVIVHSQGLYSDQIRCSFCQGAESLFILATAQLQVLQMYTNTQQRSQCGEKINCSFYLFDLQCPPLVAVKIKSYKNM